MSASAPPAVMPPARLAAMLGGWAIASFALLRSPSLQVSVLLPLAEWQAALVSRLLGTRSLPVAMTPACSGLDVMSLCAGAIALYPATRRQRLIGAAGGLVWILVLNIARIATLARAAGRPAFSVLHEYVWPGVLTLAAVAYVGAWIWRVERRPILPAARAARLALCAAALIGLYVALVALLAGAGVLTVYAAAASRFAATLLNACGVDASVNGGVLRVAEASYAITYECVTTPLLPLYLAAVLTAPWRRSARVGAAAAAVPIFALLAVVRLMSLALPPVLFGSRLFLTHGFNQLAIGGLVVVLAAAAADRDRAWGTIARRAAVGAAVGLAFGSTIGLVWTRVLAAAFPAAMRDPADLQGALPIMPAFQLALFAAVAWILRQRAPFARWLAAGGVLIVNQIAVLAIAPSVKPYLSSEWLALVWRGWTIAVPVGLAALVCRRRVTSRAGSPPSPADTHDAARAPRASRSTQRPSRAAP